MLVTQHSPCPPCHSWPSYLRCWEGITPGYVILGLNPGLCATEPHTKLLTCFSHFVHGTHHVPGLPLTSRQPRSPASTVTHWWASATTPGLVACACMFTCVRVHMCAQMCIWKPESPVVSSLISFPLIYGSISLT